MEIDTVATWLSGTLVGQMILFGAPVAFLVLALVTLRRARGLAMAEWLVAGGQFELAPVSLQNELIDEAARRGKKDVALAEFANIRRLYGHQGVRMGHIFWVYDRMNGKIRDGLQPPSFVGPPQKAPGVDRPAA